MKKTFRNGFLTAGLILAGLLTALILLGFFWTPYDPNAMAAGPKPPIYRHTKRFEKEISALCRPEGIPMPPHRQ